MMNPYSAPSATVAAPPHASGEASPGSMEALKQTRPWVLFLAILGLIGAGLAVLGSVAVVAVATLAPGPEQISPALGLIYLVLVPLYVLPSVKLLKYSAAITKLMASGGLEELERALLEQKGFWKLVGIMVIMTIALYIVLIIGAVAVFAAKFSH
jgi:hypothetical protein